MSKLKRVLLLHPSPQEQSAIVKHLADATASVEKTITRAQEEISLLREYRTRMIADVVTGKLDAREAAARLPEEAEEPDDVGAIHESPLEPGNDDNEEPDDDLAAELSEAEAE